MYPKVLKHSFTVSYLICMNSSSNVYLIEEVKLNVKVNYRIKIRDNVHKILFCIQWQRFVIQKNTKIRYKSINIQKIFTQLCPRLQNIPDNSYSSKSTKWRMWQPSITNWPWQMEKCGSEDRLMQCRWVDKQ